MSISNRELNQLLGANASGSGSSSRESVAPPPAMPLAYDAPFNDPDRLDVDDHRAQVEAGKACGSGSNYNNMPVLLGDENWAEWDEALQTAAMGEHVHALLTDSYVPPGAQPPIDTPTRTWNHWVRGYQWHKRQNFNLLAGIKRHLSPYMKDKVKDVTDAKTAYDALKSECRQRGANFVGDVISKLMVDVASNHKTIKDFSRAFISKIDQLERMALPWKLPDELFQIWYLHNLGDSFATFRSTIYQHFKVAGIGDGRPLTLRTLMERADNEYQLQLQEQQRTTTVAPAFFTGIKRNPTQAFSERQPDTRNGQPQPRRIQRKKRPSPQTIVVPTRKSAATTDGGLTKTITTTPVVAISKAKRPPLTTSTS